MPGTASLKRAELVIMCLDRCASPIDLSKKAVGQHPRYMHLRLAAQFRIPNSAFHIWLTFHR